MIKVNAKKDIIRISGHANYSDEFDIVCASVSSVVYTAVNGIFTISDDAIEFTDKDDVMTIKILTDDDLVEKLIESMLAILKELSEQYPENIMISKGE